MHIGIGYPPDDNLSWDFNIVLKQRSLAAVNSMKPSDAYMRQ